MSDAETLKAIGEHLELKRQGPNYVARCPYFNCGAEALAISPTKKFFYCFSCNTGGSLDILLKELRQLRAEVKSRFKLVSERVH